MMAAHKTMLQPAPQYLNVLLAISRSLTTPQERTPDTEAKPAHSVADIKKSSSAALPTILGVSRSAETARTLSPLTELTGLSNAFSVALPTPGLQNW